MHILHSKRVNDFYIALSITNLTKILGNKDKLYFVILHLLNNKLNLIQYLKM